MLLYTFRTTPFKDKLLELNTPIFVFGKLKEDFALFADQILKEKPDFVVGIAHAEQTSQHEARALNQFNGNKKIVQEGEPHLPLYVPAETQFAISDRGSDSFCNWTAYKIAKLIKDNNLKTRVLFSHVTTSDISKLIDALSKLE